jgi:ubiquinone/menaquinone biosynthesis C-methylase UbiE
MSDADRNLGIDAGRYTELAGFDGDWRDTWWHQDYLALVGERLRLSEVRRVLDVGCGAGHWGQRIGTLLAPGATITGVDHEEGFLEAARERAKRFEGHTFDYRKGDALSLPFEDESFDLVTCQTVLIHVADAKAALAEMLRVTRPGGLVVTAEPNNVANAFMYRVGEPEWPFEDAVRLLRFERTCIVGKARLGQGDSGIGERVPSLMLDLGLTDRRVYKNDRCSTWLPPYDTPAEQLNVAMLERSEGQQAWGYGGRETAEKVFTAGGGDPAELDELWALAERYDRHMRDAVKAGTWRFTGGLLMYLAAGRKPR